MKYIRVISLIIVFSVLLYGCYFLPEVPKDGTWYNEELDVSFECNGEEGYYYVLISNIIWKSQKNILNIEIGPATSRYFGFYIDVDGEHVNLLEGTFLYKNDQLIITAKRLAIPFDISGQLNDVDNKKIIFTRQTVDN